MIITHPKYYTSEGEITADELVELIENNFHNGHFYENITDLEKAVEFALPILNETSEARAS
ncbi:hypothetical protein V9966_000078 [Campylobacter upsaliensis]|nr:hypothetical protein [Campylobacter upsaliensis]EIJ6626542.1 hypothetical protein [Campylobacter upsaliensis]